MLFFFFFTRLLFFLTKLFSGSTTTYITRSVFCEQISILLSFVSHLNNTFIWLRVTYSSLNIYLYIGTYSLILLNLFYRKHAFLCIRYRTVTILYTFCRFIRSHYARKIILYCVCVLFFFFFTSVLNTSFFNNTIKRYHGEKIKNKLK